MDGWMAKGWGWMDGILLILFHGHDVLLYEWRRMLKVKAANIIPEEG